MKKIYKIIIILVSVMVVALVGNYAYAENITKNSSSIASRSKNEVIVDEQNDVVTINEEEQVINGGELESSKEEAKEDTGKGIAMIAAALSTGLACLGAGIAVALVASSAVGAISENPSLLGKTIIFAGLAEGIAIYGLIISIMILNKA